MVATTQNYQNKTPKTKQKQKQKKKREMNLINQPKINTNPQSLTKEPKSTNRNNKPPKIHSFQTLNNFQSNKSPNPHKIKMGKEGNFRLKTKQKNKGKMREREREDDDHLNDGVGRMA